METPICKPSIWLREHWSTEAGQLPSVPGRRGLHTYIRSQPGLQNKILVQKTKGRNYNLTCNQQKKLLVSYVHA